MKRIYLFLGVLIITALLIGPIVLANEFSDFLIWLTNLFGNGRYAVGYVISNNTTSNCSSDKFYEWFRVYPSNPAEKYGKLGWDNKSDYACCNYNTDCVYKSRCYAHNAYYDLDGDGKKDYYCYRNGTGWWINVDYHYSYCTKNGYKWNIGGDADVEGAYYTTTGSRPNYCTVNASGIPSRQCCCGDDSREFVITNFNMTRCCDKTTDCVDAAGICRSGIEFCNGLDDNCDGIVDNGGKALCNDSLHCTVDTCNGLSGCMHASLNCSVNNLPAIASCTDSSDNNSKTWDSAPAYISSCDEFNDRCTISVRMATHGCDVARCSAECDTLHTCAATNCSGLDGCYGNGLARSYRDYSNAPNSCQSGCLCTHNACSSFAAVVTDADGDGYDTQCDNDCNDNNGSIHPGATELCNGVDDTCDNRTDEGCLCVSGRTQQCGFSNLGKCKYGMQTCIAGSLGACTGAISPDPNEVCNNVDDDCDGSVDDDLARNETCGVGACLRTVIQSCSAGSWSPACIPNNPGTEVCNNVDDDCDGSVDEDLVVDCGGVGVCHVEIACGEDCPPLPEGSQEICDGEDNDCNGQIDEETVADCGGIGECHTEVACGEECPEIPDGSQEICDGLDNDCDAVADNDCVDENDDVNDEDENICVPSAEICNGFDDDCDGVADNDCVDESYDMSDNFNYDEDVCVPSAEVCNGVDDDCDGVVDNDCVQGDDDGVVRNTVGLGSGSNNCTRSPEVCDGKDNDCNGKIDDNPQCPPAGKTIGRSTRFSWFYKILDELVDLAREIVGV